MVDTLSRVIYRDLKDLRNKICVPIKVKTVQEAIRLAKKARQKGAKYLEIWLDSLSDDPILTLSKPKYRFLHPYIAVCKGKKEHGSFQGTEEARMDVLMAAAFSGADFVDIGITTNEKLLKHAIRRIKKSSKTKIILSYHNFQKPPSLETLLEICKKSFALGAHIVKIATKVKNGSDNVTLFELCSRLNKQKKKFIIVGMGKKGIVSRIGCLYLGGYFTYAASHKSQRTAQHQPVLVS